MLSRASYSGPFRAERRLGELMVEQPKATGLRSKGIDKNLVKRAPPIVTNLVTNWCTHLGRCHRGLRSSLRRRHPLANAPPVGAQ